jgi:hypothetical protein
MQNTTMHDDQEISLSVTTKTPAQIKAELQAMFDNQRAHKECLTMTINWVLTRKVAGTSEQLRAINFDAVYRLYNRVVTDQIASQPLVDHFIKAYTIALSVDNLQFM